MTRVPDRWRSGDRVLLLRGFGHGLVGFVWRHAHLFSLAHDVSDGGVAVALAECCTTSPTDVPDFGARVDLDGDLGAAPAEVAARLFGEHPPRVVLSVRPEHLADVTSRAEKAGVPARELGVTGGADLSIALVGGPAAVFHMPLHVLRTAREACLDGLEHGAAGPA